MLWKLRTQTPTQNSSQRQTENRFPPVSPRCGQYLANASLSDKRKRLHVVRRRGKHTHTHTECFYLWCSTLIEFFNNAHQKRRTWFNLASLLFLQGINILERKGRFLWEGEKRERRRKKKEKKKLVRKQLSVNEWHGRQPQWNVNEEQYAGSDCRRTWKCRDSNTPDSLRHSRLAPKQIISRHTVVRRHSHRLEPFLSGDASSWSRCWSKCILMPITCAQTRHLPCYICLTQLTGA